jgi:hypothetical protein
MLAATVPDRLGLADHCPTVEINRLIETLLSPPEIVFFLSLPDVHAHRHFPPKFSLIAFGGIGWAV